jgi:hypothetical protein
MLNVVFHLSSISCIFLLLNDPTCCLLADGTDGEGGVGFSLSVCAYT